MPVAIINETDSLEIRNDEGDLIVRMVAHTDGEVEITAIDGHVVTEEHEAEFIANWLEEVVHG